ncbi:MAG: SAM-dependent methyltransferase [Myxococcota bacterium]
MVESLQNPVFPRSNRYDPAWVLANNMGPNPLWLTEWLTEYVKLTPGMRVLDLGCGKALSSVFLAREFDVHVVAADLWTSVDDNWQRIVSAGEERRVVPVHAEAHALPFAAGYFDAVICVDAYPYFGTDILYLHYLSRFVRPGGQIGVAMPGLTRELPPDGVPDHLRQPQKSGKVFWESECVSFKTAAWWREHFHACDRVAVNVADTLPDGWRHWRNYELAAERSGAAPFPSDAEALEADEGRYIGFVRVIATRNDVGGENLYDPDLVWKVEHDISSLK